MCAEVRYLFCFFVVAKVCFSLSIVEVERIVTIKVTLKKEKHKKVKGPKKCIESVSSLLVE